MKPTTIVLSLRNAAFATVAAAVVWLVIMALAGADGAVETLGAKARVWVGFAVLFAVLFLITLGWYTVNPPEEERE